MISAPQPLADHHLVETFDCGEPTLDDWLKRRARSNQASGASHTYVVCAGEAVVGYYCLAAGALAIPKLLARCAATGLTLSR